VHTDSLKIADRMFYGCTKLNSFTPGSAFVTANITSAISMYENCINLPLVISAYNWSGIINAERMFCNCDKIVTVDACNIPNATNTKGLFKDSNNINAIKTMNVGKSTNCAEMFSGCAKLNTLTNLNVSSSDSANETNIFTGCKLLKTIRFSGTKAFTTIDLSNTALDSNALTNLITSLPITTTSNLKITGTSASSTITDIQKNDALYKGYVITL
jgi:hypothetical protein